MKVRRTGRILQEIIQTLKEHQKNRVKHLKIFGSYVRNDQKEDRDLDLMVSFEETPTLLEFIDLKGYLENITGINFTLSLNFQTLFQAEQIDEFSEHYRHHRGDSGNVLEGFHNPNPSHSERSEESTANNIEILRLQSSLRMTKKVILRAKPEGSLKVDSHFFKQPHDTIG